MILNLCVDKSPWKLQRQPEASGSTKLLSLQSHSFVSLPVMVWCIFWSTQPVASVSVYAAMPLPNVLATTCQYEALQYVSFAVQKLGKCAKMFAVMEWGFLITKKSRVVRDVAVTACITGGCFIFSTTGQTAWPLSEGPIIE
jgi:hypothetical protein